MQIIYCNTKRLHTTVEFISAILALPESIASCSVWYTATVVTYEFIPTTPPSVGYQTTSRTVSMSCDMEGKSALDTGSIHQARFLPTDKTISLRLLKYSSHI